MPSPTSPSETVSPADQQLIEAAYRAFNARSIDRILPIMHADVRWPRAWEGDYVQGHAQVRDYWTRQWADIVPVVEPLELRQRPGGRVAVLVQQTVHDHAGQLLQAGPTTHVFTIREGLIQQMDIEAAT